MAKDKKLGQRREVMSQKRVCEKIICGQVDSNFISEKVKSVDESFQNQRSKRKLVEDEHYRENFSREIRETQNYCLQNDSSFDTFEFSSRMESPSLVIPPRPHKMKKWNTVTNFVEVPQNQLLVDTSDVIGDSSIPVLGSSCEVSQIPSKSKMLNEVLLFRKEFLNVLENENDQVLTEIFPDSHSNYHDSISMYPEINSAAGVSSHQSKCSSKLHSVLHYPLISTEPIIEILFEEHEMLPSQPTLLPGEHPDIEQHLKEEFYTDVHNSFEEEMGCSFQIVDYPTERDETYQSEFCCHVSAMDQERMIAREGSSDEVSYSKLSDNSRSQPLEYEDDFSPVTSSAKGASQQSTLEIPNQLYSPQEKQYYRPGPASSKKIIPSAGLLAIIPSSGAAVKESKQETSKEAVTTRHKTRPSVEEKMERIRISSRLPLRSSLKGNRISTIPALKSGAGDKNPNEVYLRNLRSASVKSDDRNSDIRFRKSQTLPEEKTVKTSRCAGDKTSASTKSSDRTTRRSSRALESQDSMSKQSSSEISSPIISPVVELKLSLSSFGRTLRKSLKYQELEKLSRRNDSTKRNVSQEKSSKEIEKDSSVKSRRPTLASNNSSRKSDETEICQSSKYSAVKSSTVVSGDADFDSAPLVVSTKKPDKRGEKSKSVAYPKATGANVKSHVKTLSRPFTPAWFEKIRTRSTSKRTMLLKGRKSSIKKDGSNIAQDQQRGKSDTLTTLLLPVAKAPKERQPLMTRFLNREKQKSLVVKWEDEEPKIPDRRDFVPLSNRLMLDPVFQAKVRTKEAAKRKPSDTKKKEEGKIVNRATNKNNLRIGGTNVTKNFGLRTRSGGKVV